MLFKWQSVFVQSQKQTAKKLESLKYKLTFCSSTNWFLYYLWHVVQVTVNRSPTPHPPNPNIIFATGITFNLCSVVYKQFWFIQASPQFSNLKSLVPAPLPADVGMYTTAYSQSVSWISLFPNTHTVWCNLRRLHTHTHTHTHTTQTHSAYTRWPDPNP